MNILPVFSDKILCEGEKNVSGTPCVTSQFKHQACNCRVSYGVAGDKRVLHLEEKPMKINLKTSGNIVSARATAKLKGGNISGKASFTEYDVGGWKYVHSRLTVKGDPKILKPGKHAVHIHEKGDCDCEGFKCAGGHFDPGPFGNSDPDANHGYHAGDLPNITVDNDGGGELETITTRVTLSDGPVSILQPAEGTSIMVHANPDPYTPGESGSGHSGGLRLACGRIEKA
jgi:Cu-Zn family superoxide dismutase